MTLPAARTRLHDLPRRLPARLLVGLVLLVQTMAALSDYGCEEQVRWSLERDHAYQQALEDHDYKTLRSLKNDKPPECPKTKHGELDTECARSAGISAKDESRAAQHRKERAQLLGLGNSQLIAEAGRLDDTLWKEGKDEIGPAEKAEVARTLRAMQKELWDRIAKEPVGKKIEGIEWDESSPLRGMVEDLPAFARHDLWNSFVVEYEDILEKCRKRQQSSPKRKRDDTAKTETSPEPKPARRVPRMDDKMMPREQALEEAQDALKEQGNNGKRHLVEQASYRMQCMLNLLEQPGTDGLFYSEKNVQALLNSLGGTPGAYKNDILNDTLDKHQVKALDRALSSTDPMWREKLRLKTGKEREDYAESLSKIVSTMLLKENLQGESREQYRGNAQDIIRKRATWTNDKDMLAKDLSDLESTINNGKHHVEYEVRHRTVVGGGKGVNWVLQFINDDIAERRLNPRSIYKCYDGTY